MLGFMMGVPSVLKYISRHLGCLFSPRILDWLRPYTPFPSVSHRNHNHSAESECATCTVMSGLYLLKGCPYRLCFLCKPHLCLSSTSPPQLALPSNRHPFLLSVTVGG